MAASIIGKVPFFVTPWMCVRHASKKKVNVRRPRPRHLERRIFEAVARPIVPQIHSDKLLCPKLDKIMVEEENRYEQFLIRECKKQYENHSLVAVFSHLPIGGQRYKEIYNKLSKKGLMLKRCNNGVTLKTIKGTKWENLSPLFRGFNIYVVSNELNLADLIATTKSIPEMELIGGVVGENLMSRADIQYYATKPSIELLRGELVSILGAAAGKTHRLLGSHQQNLSINLTQYVKQNTEEKKED